MLDETFFLNFPDVNVGSLTLLHLEGPKLCRVLAVLHAIGLKGHSHDCVS